MHEDRLPDGPRIATLEPLDPDTVRYIIDAENEIARLRAALIYYADPETYRGYFDEDPDILGDRGQKARKALHYQRPGQPA